MMLSEGGHSCPPLWRSLMRMRPNRREQDRSVLPPLLSCDDLFDAGHELGDIGALLDALALL